MSGNAFAVTHHAFSSGAGRTSDGNGSHASTLKSPSYTKSVSWQHYQNSRKLQELIWDKLVAYVNDFNLSNQEKSRLILRLFDDVKLLFNEVPVSILVNDIFLKDFFMKQPDFAKWYFYQLLKKYEGEQLYLNELGYVYGNEEKTNEIVNNNPGYVVEIFEEKMGNELKIRTRMMEILRDGKINIYEYINKEQLEKLNPPEDLRIAIKKLGWNN